MVTGRGGQDIPTTLGLIEQALFASVAPKKLGRFEVVGQLGRGGMGVVYRARDPDLKRTVAIKVHRRGVADDGRERLRKEAEALARVRHRNVVHVYEVGWTEAGDVFVVMELLPAVTLRDWVREQGPSVTAVCEMLARCGQGLAAAHAEGLVHRDFKPENVVIDDDGEPRIIDFGLARDDVYAATIPQGPNADGEDALRSALAGTSRYMAPELWDGGSPSAASDQFALAVSLYECIAGTPPFLERRFEPPPRPRTMPRRVWSVLRRALERMPVDRWPSVDVFVSRLRVATGGTRGAGVGVGVLALAVGATTWAVMKPSQRDPEPTAGRVDVVPDELGACPVGEELVAQRDGWHWNGDVSHDDDGLHLSLRPGPPSLSRAVFDMPMSFRDRSVVFEMSRLPSVGTSHEVYMSLDMGAGEAVSVLVWGGQWAFPMATNTRGLSLPIDRTRDLLFRIQVQEQPHAYDFVTFELSGDGQTWTPIARVEGTVGRARVLVQIDSHDPIETPDVVIVKRITCGTLQPVAELNPERDRARVPPLFKGTHRSQP